jgi:hypothetical protein
MSAFSIMAHALAHELAARGFGELAPHDCEEILRRVTDRASAVASNKRPGPAGDGKPPEGRSS